MKSSFRKQLIVVCMVVAGIGMFYSCSKEEKEMLKAEVKLANKSVYVWNRGDRAWRGGMVFINERSQEISKSFGTVNPRGFAQLPLREFRKDSKPVPQNSLQPEFVWVETEGYAPKKFKLDTDS